MSNYQTPGVYVKEIATLPPSVAQVETAIPAFIGYTESGAANQTVRITSMLEYREAFGGPQALAAINLVMDADGSIVEGSLSGDILSPENKQPKFLLYDSLMLYFSNGGGPCYVISLGQYPSSLSDILTNYTDGLTALEKVDEPTLILLTDAVTSPDYYSICALALAQCAKLMDRFTIIDVPEGVGITNPAQNFRDTLGPDNLDYGAAYTPYLETYLSPAYGESSVSLNIRTADLPSVQEFYPTAKTAQNMSDLKEDNTKLYNQIKSFLSSKRTILPPSAAMAGIYARVDHDRGVWKSPANVGVIGVASLSQNITNKKQEGLNIDPIAGKSINAIRYFTGKGILVWGARTLAGNDNEWRYVSVRRLFITIEESVQKASSFAVFEPNDSTTWLKVKAMIDNYLYGLWQQGALAGSKPEDSYFVNVGLGKTMTAQDILEGRMIVEIGIAAVRPAEFIILKFSHMLQQS